MSIIVYYLHESRAHLVPFDDSDMLRALDACKRLRDEGHRHVTISTELADSIGKPGVDSIVDGKTPDGHDYTWMKRRDQ